MGGRARGVCWGGNLGLTLTRVSSTSPMLLIIIICAYFLVCHHPTEHTYVVEHCYSKETILVTMGKMIYRNRINGSFSMMFPMICVFLLAAGC